MSNGYFIQPISLVKPGNKNCSCLRQCLCGAGAPFDKLRAWFPRAFRMLHLSGQECPLHTSKWQTSHSCLDAEKTGGVTPQAKLPRQLAGQHGSAIHVENLAGDEARVLGAEK